PGSAIAAQTVPLAFNVWLRISRTCSDQGCARSPKRETPCAAAAPAQMLVSPAPRPAALASGARVASMVEADRLVRFPKGELPGSGRRRARHSRKERQAHASNEVPLVSIVSREVGPRP